MGQSRRADAIKSLAAEYALNWQLECFMKPTVSLIDGVVVGSGVGISLYGTHRVAGERYRFAMPETGIGLFPDVGVAWAFARLPDEIGMYLGLTGRAIGRADAYRLGLATHCIPGPASRRSAPGLPMPIPSTTCSTPVTRTPAPGSSSPGARSSPGASPPTAWRTSSGACNRRPALPPHGRDRRRGARATLPDLAQDHPSPYQGARALDLRATLAQDFRLGCRCLEPTISTRACGRSSSTGTAPPSGSRQH